MNRRQSLRHLRPLLIFLIVLESVFPQDLRGGENRIHSPKNSTSQARHFQRGRFRLGIANLGAFVPSLYSGLTDNGALLLTAAGLMIAGKEHTTGELCTSMGGPYSDYENQPGLLKSVYTGDSSAAADPNDPAFRIYAIQRSDTAGSSNPDYVQWPAAQGAPVAANGKPLFLGQQQFFFVYNDLKTSATPPRGHPLGIEVRVLGWWDDGIPLLSGTFFFRFQIINRSIFSYDSVYVGLWADPDIGWQYHRDLVGCDTTLRLLYAYKEIEHDHATYGITPPSIGFQFLDVQKPGGPAGKDLFRFVPIQRGSPDYYLFYPEVGPYSTDFHQHMYNYLRGLGYNGQTIINPQTGEGSTRAISGDPVTFLGWLPKNSGLLPMDFRMMGSTGPSHLAPGDTQTVTTALIVAQGQDRLGSLAQLRFNAEQILAAYPSTAGLSVTVEPAWSVEYPAGASPRAHAAATTTGIQSCAAEFFDGDGQRILTSPMSGTGLFSTVVELAPAVQPGFADLVAQTTWGRGIRYRGAFNRLSTAARPKQRRVQITHDQSNGDGLANPGEQVEFSLSLFNGAAWTFDSLTLDPSYTSATMLLTGGSFRGVRPGEESAILQPIVVAVDASAGDTRQTLLPYMLTENTWSNRWLDTLRIPVQPFSFLPEETFPIHVTGKATRTPSISLVNPSAWKDHQYAITFPSADSLLVIDLSTGDTLVPTHLFNWFSYAIPRAGDASRLVIDGFKILPGNLRDTYAEIREYLGPAGIALESESHEQAQRLGRDLRNGRANSTNRYSVRLVYTGFSAPPIELRATERGSRYYLGPGANNIIRLAPDRLPFEIWDLQESPDDPSDDQRLTMLVADADSNRQFTASECITGTHAYPYSESPPDSTTHNYNYYRDLALSFAPAPGGQFALPEIGTALLFYGSIPPTPEDVYVVRPASALMPPPESLTLYNSFPNPFNPTTTIKFYLPRKSRVQVRVYDVLGAEVAALLDEERETGIHYAFWEGKNGSGRKVASGVYLYRVATPSAAAAGKMILLR